MSSLVPRVILPVALVLAACQLLIALALGFLTGAAVSPVAILALIGAGMVGAVSAALWALCRFVKRPLQSLTAQLAKAKAGAFLGRAKSEGGQAREIAELSEAFNATLATITSMQVAEIETGFQMKQMEGELLLKAELEKQNSRIEKANAELEQRVREMTLLLDVARQLGSSLELSKVLREVTELVSVSMGVDQFTVMLLEEDDALKIAASFGLDAARCSSFRLKMGEGASGIAAQTREPVYIADIQSDPRFVRGPDDPEGDSSLLCVPMLCRDRFVGILNFSRMRKDAFSDSDIVLLQLLTSQVALAVLNAQLYTSMRSQSAHDPVTGCLRERHLSERIDLELLRARRLTHPLSLLVVEVDGCEDIARERGAQLAEAIMRKVADICRTSARGTDTVGRLGGQALLVALPNCQKREAETFAEMLRRSVEQCRDFGEVAGEQAPRVTLSVGVAAWPEDAEERERLVAAADGACGAAKAAGRNRTALFDKSMAIEAGAASEASEAQSV